MRVLSDFAGMSVNERLFVAGLLPSFDAAAKAGDRDGLIALLGKVDLGGQAPQIADAVLSRSDPAILGQRSFAPTRRNRQGREVWFERWLWSYMPCSWKGWAVMACLIAAGLGTAFLLNWILGSPESGLEMFIPLGLTLVASWIVAERHCP